MCISIFLFVLVPFTQETNFVEFKNLDPEVFGVNQLHTQVWNDDGSFWAISDNGLVLHNGFTGKFFPVTADENGPLSAEIITLHEVEDGELWLTYMDTNFVTVLNRATQRFQHYEIDSLLRDGQLAALLTRFKKDNKGQLWASTWGDGLYKLSPEFKVIEVQRFPLESDTNLVSCYIKDFAVLDDDRLFVTFFSQKYNMRDLPLYYDPEAKEYERIDIDHYARLLDKNILIKIPAIIIHWVYEDKNKNLWLGSYSGLLFIDTDKQTIERISHASDNQEDINYANVFSYVVENGKIWMCTPNKGVMTVDIETKQTTYYSNAPLNKNSLADNRIESISVDPLGHIWVCTEPGAISIYVPYINLFEIHPWNTMGLAYSNQSEQTIPVNQLLVEDSRNVLITNRDGIAVYNIHNRNVDNYLRTDELTFSGNSKKSGGIIGSIKSNGDEHWICYNHKPAIANLEKKKVTLLDRNEELGNRFGLLFRHEPKVDRYIYFENPMFPLSQLPNQNKIGLFEYNKDQNKFTLLAEPPENIKLRETFSFLTNNGNWIISVNGGRFMLVDPSTYKLKIFRPSDPESFFPDSTVNCVLVDDGHDILIGTSKDLYRFNEVNYEYELLSEKVGLKEGDGVNALIRDDQGRLWMALRKDLICWDQSTNNSVRYNSTLGINVGSFLPAIAQKDELGNLYFATMSGILVFDPNKTELPDNELIIDLLSLEVNDEPTDSTLISNLLSGEHNFHWSDNFLTFRFRTNQLFGPEPHQFKYRLIGESDKWVEVGSSNELRFPNLRHGDYQLEVVATNTYGVTSKPFVIGFSIQRPFWLSFWFYLVVGVLVVASVFYYIKYRERALKKRSELLERTVTERTAEVVEQKHEAERQRAEAEHQKQIVEVKQQEITDSITYAKRIQDAIMPSEDIIKSHLPKSFVMYRPKDIIAGDFYWMEPLSDNEFIIAAADCTGHGVPGAMVSVVCNNALNRSVREFKITDPGELLNNTRELVIEQFEKGINGESTDTNNVIKDGMDISLCCINRKSNILKWAGANNPLWLIRDGELIEIKGNKQPIGKFHQMEDFLTHELKIEENDVFYIFSDGYVDQFGGEKGKKFKSSSLKKLLLSIHKDPIKIQHVKLEEQFDNWKGDYEQLDDVCIIGFKV